MTAIVPTQSLTDRFNSRVPWPLRLGLVFVLALVLAFAVVPRLTYLGLVVAAKLRGKAPNCSWVQILSSYGNLMRFDHLEKASLSALSVKAYDDTFDIELISSSTKDFWIRRRGLEKDGKSLLAYLLAEHKWIAESNPGSAVRPGDVVLDCGAHVGVFTHKALQLGARTVVAIEPDPVNLECLRRNFADEIASRRVVVVPKGVWSSEGTITLYISNYNSGMDSMINKQEGGSIKVPVSRIDILVSEIHLERVDYIKMDIEGAEREALQGAIQTLRTYRPRLMLDAYHRPDDMQVLPAILRQSHSDYLMRCGPCLPYSDGSEEIDPHAIFFE